MTKLELGTQIEERRKSLKVNQPALAELAEVSIMTIVSIESGKGNPTLDTLYKVMHVLGLTLEIKATKADN
ncbi:hypothetical protein BH11BAC7_BH11BAC7_22240 [soil metagenome]